jgi:CTP-dependent riboflavin kinase
LRKLAELRGQSAGKARARLETIEEWSSQHKWQDRVKQYDAEQLRERMAKKLEKRDEMEDRHAEEAKEEQEIARKLLKDGAIKGKVSIAAVQLLKNSREDERKALTEEEKPMFEQGAPVIGIAIYLPQKQMLPKKEDNVDGSSES